jgi:hypothetical protein
MDSGPVIRLLVVASLGLATLNAFSLWGIR